MPTEPYVPQLEMIFAKLNGPQQALLAHVSTIDGIGDVLLRILNVDDKAALVARGLLDVGADPGQPQLTWLGITVGWFADQQLNDGPTVHERYDLARRIQNEHALMRAERNRRRWWRRRRDR